MSLAAAGYAFAVVQASAVPASAETAEEKVRRATTLMLRDVQTPEGFDLSPLAGSPGTFAVTVPKMSVPSYETQAWEITTARFEMTPNDGAKVDVKIAAPGSIRLRDGGGAEVLRVAVGGWDGAGVFDTEVERFVSFDGEGRDIQAMIVADQSSVSVQGFSVLGDFAPNGAGGWKTPLRMQATDLRVQLPDGADAMRLGELVVRGDSTILDWDTLRRRLEAMQSRLSAPGFSELPEDEQDAIMLDLIVGLRGLLADLQVGYEVRDLAIDVEGDPFRADRLAATVDGTGFDQSKFQFRLGYAIEGMTLTVEELPADLAPDGAALTLALADMPSRAVVDLLADIAALTRSSPDRDGGEIFLKGLMTLMQNAGSELRIERFGLANSLAQLEASGQMQPVSTAQYGGIGNFRMFVQGLDPLIQRLIGDPDEEVQGFGLLLSLVRAYGIPAQDGEPSMLQYDIDLPAEGPVLVNGKPLQVPGAE